MTIVEFENIIKTVKWSLVPVGSLDIYLLHNDDNQPTKIRLRKFEEDYLIEVVINKELLTVPEFNGVVQYTLSEFDIEESVPNKMVRLFKWSGFINPDSNPSIDNYSTYEIDINGEIIDKLYYPIFTFSTKEYLYLNTKTTTNEKNGYKRGLQ